MWCWLPVGHSAGTGVVVLKEASEDKSMKKGSGVRNAVDFFLAEASHRVKEVAKLQTHEEFETAGWKDISHGSVKECIRFSQNDQRVSLILRCNLEEAFMAAFQTQAPAKVSCSRGFSSFRFPMKLSLTPLKLLGDNTAFVHVKAKFCFITFDSVMLVTFTDRLDTDECGEIQIYCAPRGMEGKNWLGITVPQKSSFIRLALTDLRISVRPTANNCSLLELHINHTVQRGLERVSTSLSKVVGRQFVSMFVSVVSKLGEFVVDDTHIRGGERSSTSTGGFIHFQESLQKFIVRKQKIAVSSMPSVGC